MSVKVAINGYGRIGRCILRALYESDMRESLVIVGINELASLESIAHLTQYDSTHGKFHGKVDTDSNDLVINGDRINVSCERDMCRLPWGKLDVDVVLECSGSYSEMNLAASHLQSGAKRVIFSCPAQSDVDATVVYGFNETLLTKQHTIISNASCTSNCIAHVINLLDNCLQIENGVITTIHSMMNDQPVIDAYHHPDLRKSRSSGNSIIPVDTGLAKGLERFFPHLQGRFEAVSLRVPTMNVSAIQLTINTKRETQIEAVNEMFRDAAEGELKGILGYSKRPLVSCDFNHDSRSAIIDGNQTSVNGGTLVNVMAWFDNEWGYANRMLDTTLALMNARL